MAISLLDMTFDELASAVAEMGEPSYRAGQLADWVYGKGITDPAGMSNLPRRLLDAFDILTSQVSKCQVSKDGTSKLLIALADGQHVETVLIPDRRRATACLSSQVGCAMRCSFCASGVGGLKRNCGSGEMLQQILHLQKTCRTKVTNVVFMGMGEPLANYDQTVKAMKALTDPKRFGISARKITISTIGLPDKIRRLAKLREPFTLAISLHAPNDQLRARLIPEASSVPMRQIVSAASEFYESRHREITLEYLLLGGVNDSLDCADELAEIGGKLRCNVNLIPYNPVLELPYHRPSPIAVKAFADRLSKRGVNANIRRPRGLDIAAACGQLRRDAQTIDSTNTSCR